MFSKNACDGAYNGMDVRFTKACDNNCAFCIDRRGIGSLGSTRVPEMIEATRSQKPDDVLILGGEPFLLPEKLLQYVRGIRPHVHALYITTSLPNTTYTTYTTYASEILKLIDGLNVSIQSTDPTENNRILNATSNHDRLELLRNLNLYWGSKIRTSINLTRGGIDSQEKLLKSLDDLVGLGCEHIKINELQHSPDLYVSYESIMGVKLPSPYAHGCQTYIENHKGARILLKRSCFVVEPSNKANLMDACKAVYKRIKKPNGRFKVLYENADVQGTWLESHNN